ncbi:MAG: S41 family peptidase [Maricaulaceae bacterium]
MRRSRTDAKIFAFLIALGATASAASSQDAPSAFAADVDRLFEIVETQYVYEPPRPLDRGAFGSAPQTPLEVLRIAEAVVAQLADHHVGLSTNAPDSYDVAPSRLDLWVEAREDAYVITEVKRDTPAARAGLRPGGLVIAIDDTPIADAVARFMAAPEPELSDREKSYAAQILLTGRRDRPRAFTVRTPEGAERAFALDRVAWPGANAGTPVTATPVDDGAVWLRIENALDDERTIAAFDAVLEAHKDATGLILDLRNTPSGGDTYVARAIMGRLIDNPSPYQLYRPKPKSGVNAVPYGYVEWIYPPGTFQVSVPVVVLVSRWTGSVGEAIAVGLDAAGFTVLGGPMAGLAGAITEHCLPVTDICVSLPTQRIFHVNGTPRHEWRPQNLLRFAETHPDTGEDAGLAAARRTLAALMTEAGDTL